MEEPKENYLEKTNDEVVKLIEQLGAARTKKERTRIGVELSRVLRVDGIEQAKSGRLKPSKMELLAYNTN